MQDLGEDAERVLRHHLNDVVCALLNERKRADDELHALEVDTRGGERPQAQVLLARRNAHAVCVARHHEGVVPAVVATHDQEVAGTLG